jgi:predicted phosphodiesterase
MLIQVISDLHLETKPGFQPRPPRRAPVLFLAGDIGNPHSHQWRLFIEYCAQTWDHVFYVAGNHESYKNDVNVIEDYIASELKSNMTLLRRGVVAEWEGWSVRGCTLWSRATPAAFKSMNDHYYIKDGAEAFTAASMLKRHEDDVEWLTAELKKPGPTIVMTHHCPSFSLMSPQYEKYGELNTGFYTALDELLETEEKRVWICGHTHTACDKVVRGTRCIINPIGYSREDSSYRDEAFEV